MTAPTWVDVPEHTHRRPPVVRPALSRLRLLVGALLVTAAGAAGVAMKPHKASLARLWDMPLTVVGVGFGDFAAFHLAHGWGWLVTGISLVVLEHLISDPEG